MFGSLQQRRAGPTGRHGVSAQTVAVRAPGNAFVSANHHLQSSLTHVSVPNSNTELALKKAVLVSYGAHFTCCRYHHHHHVFIDS